MGELNARLRRLSENDRLVVFRLSGLVMGFHADAVAVAVMLPGLFMQIRHR